jgi:hypothetical protein
MRPGKFICPHGCGECASPQCPDCDATCQFVPEATYRENRLALVAAKAEEGVKADPDHIAAADRFELPNREERGREWFRRMRAHCQSATGPN